jgi:hypothetical protein
MTELHPVNCDCYTCNPFQPMACTVKGPTHGLWLSMVEGEQPPLGWKRPGYQLVRQYDWLSFHL